VTRPDEHLQYEELAAGHALSALEPEDEQRFLAHLAMCARCERDVDEHRSTMAAMAWTTDQVEPPPALLARIHEDVRASGRATAPPASVPAPAPRGDTDAPVRDEVAVARRRRSGVGPAGRWTAVAAGAALVVSLGVWNVTLRSDREASQARISALERAVENFGRPGTEAVPLTSEEGALVAVAMVHAREVSLVVDGLIPNREGTTYVLWAQDDEGGVRPVGAFDVSAWQLAVVENLPSVQPLDEVSALLVSREQGEVAPPAPGGPVLASGKA